ncbi:MAG: Zn-ribbon domain-containing OB-fold protein [Methanimicrococcus sp.]|nr:Zn-ribbon domain-containing OB-fold protein [Methanimicrococcus sp.]
MTVPRFWREQQSRYNLVGSHCRTCGSYYYPIRNLCPDCRRDGDMEQYKFKGNGKIVTYTITHTTSDDFSDLVPYVLAIVELDEGAKLTTQIVDEPEKVATGKRVHAVFRRLGSDGDSGMIYYGTKFELDKE